MLKDQKTKVNKDEVEIKAEMLEMETRAIVDKVLEMGDGDVAVGAIKAVESGVLDNPFDTTQFVAGKILGVRDNEGVVRYMDHGNLLFTKEIVKFHKEKIAEREKEEGKKVDYDSVVNDLFSISMGPW